MIPSWLADWQRLLRDTPRWLFVAALVFAPWAYGCTTERTIEGLNWILTATIGLWIIGNLIVRRAPVVPALLIAGAGAILVFGWWMVLNAHSIYDPESVAFVPVSALAASAPGSIDRAISGAWMIRGTLLLAVVLFMSDLSQRSRWLLRVWWTCAATGGSIALLGLLQKASNAEMIFWGTRPTQGRFETFFSTFYYHANAGAYLNLTVPLIVGLLIRAIPMRRQPFVRAISITIALISVAAVFANTSRMGQLLGGVAIVTMLVAFRSRLRELAARFSWKTTAAVSTALLIGLVAVLQAGRLDRSLGRWTGFSEHLPADERWLAATAAFHGVPEAGIFGFGPGTFRVAFPYLMPYAGEKLGGVWRFLHQDYLQTVLEWGYAGTPLWALLFGCGIVTAVRALRGPRAEEWTPRRRLLLPLVLLALATVLLHALVDFPLQIASIQLYVATYLGICWGSARWPREVEVTSARTSGVEAAHREARSS